MPDPRMTRGQLLRLRLRAWNRLTCVAWLVIFAIGEARGAAQAAADHSWVPALIAPAAFIVVAILAALVPAIKENRALRLESVSPEAVRAIRDGLAAAGLPIPDQIRLAGRGVTASRFSSFPRRRVRLYVALPQLLAVPSGHLPVLAANALAVGQVTAYPVSAQKLWKKRGALEDRDATLRARGRSSSREARRIRAFLAATEPFAENVRRHSDQAAMTAAGSADAAARALYDELTVSLDFFRYIARFHDLIARKRRVPGSIHAGWLTQWTADPEWVQYLTRYPVEAFRYEHGALGAFDTDGLPAHISRLRRGQEGMAAAAVVSPDLAKRLAKEVAKRMSPSTKVIRAVEGSAIDVTCVYEQAVSDETAVIRAASTLLERPADRVEVVDLFQQGRGWELAEFMLDESEMDDETPDGGLIRGAIFAALLIAAIEGRDMHQLDPYREWIFTGPDGELLDVAEVVAQAVSAQGDTERLRSLLRG